jgi:hypothetical protein
MSLGQIVSTVARNRHVNQEVKAPQSTRRPGILGLEEPIFGEQIDFVPLPSPWGREAGPEDGWEGPAWR